MNPLNVASRSFIVNPRPLTFAIERYVAKYRAVDESAQLKIVRQQFAGERAGPFSGSFMFRSAVSVLQVGFDGAEGHKIVQEPGKISFVIDIAAYAVKGCLIFRSEGISTARSVYWVLSRPISGR